MNVADLQLATQHLGGLPVINVFSDRLGLPELLERFVGSRDARLRIAPSVVLGVVIRNLVIHHQPVYALGEWAKPYDPALLGLARGDVELLNDDRVGRSLERLFHADRASLLTRLVLDAVAAFEIDLERLHNDSTSISFAGVHARADGRERGGKATAEITFGRSKDRRPDLKQLLWILTVTADGAVPIAYRAESGNVSDATTHIQTWSELVALTGRSDFLYVSDCKLATRANMDHIHRAGGRFLSVLPANRKEDRAFRDWLVEHTPEWAFATSNPRRYPNAADDVWHTTEAPSPSAEGYRIVWLHSSAKEGRDATKRHEHIAQGIHALDALNQRLASPRSRIRSVEAADEAAHAALDATRSGRWLRYSIEVRTSERYRQEKRGRPGAKTRYRKLTRTHHHLAWRVDEQQVARDAASDGCWPLITNDRSITGAAALESYKWQPNLEKRHAQLKGTQLVAPLFLRDPTRIEGLLCTHFIAMLIQALIERTIRNAMRDRGLHQLSLYPEDRGCPAPTSARILDIFTGVARHHLKDPTGATLRTFQPELNELQRQVLNLLDIPESVYNDTPSLGDE